jgi:hypothetical protein
VIVCHVSAVSRGHKFSEYGIPKIQIQKLAFKNKNIVVFGRGLLK